MSTECNVRTLSIPGATSFLATDNLDATVQGVNDLQREYSDRYGAADYRPDMVVTYWSFRLMIGFGLLAAAVAALGPVAHPWRSRRRWAVVHPPGAGGRRHPAAGQLARLGLHRDGAPAVGRGAQPHRPRRGAHVHREGVSGAVSSGTLLTSVIVFTVLYGVLAAIEVGLLVRTVRKGPAAATPRTGHDADADDRMTFAY